jgi:deazaflavin-dependent oxidoreductase (nitroreductase family)
MASEQQIVDSPTEWVADHIARYVQSNGEDGHIWQGVPTLLLTTVGKVSGVNRRTALIYGRIGNDYVIVASKGGHPTNPLWYNNLVSYPTVRLQVGAEVFDATASTMAEGSERETAWAEMVEIWPGFADYQEKTDRRIPLVQLQRIN